MKQKGCTEVLKLRKKALMVLPQLPPRKIAPKKNCPPDNCPLDNCPQEKFPPR